MTLNELVASLYTAAGEPPDLEYRDGALAVDVASPNWLELTRLVNEAQNAISTWTHQDGRRMRMRLTEDTARLVARRDTSAVAGVTGTVVTLTTNSLVRDTYRGWMIQGASGATALVFMSYVTGGSDVLMLSEVSGTFTVGEVVTLIARTFRFADVSVAVPPFVSGQIYADYTYGKPLEIVGVYSIDGQELSLGFEEDRFVVKTANASPPTAYSKHSLGLTFDSYPDAAYEYVVRFMRLPRPFTVLDEAVECELPEQFHRAVVLYCFWWLLLRSHEVDKAYAVRRNFEDILKRTQTEYDLQDRVQRGQFKLAIDG